MALIYITGQPGVGKTTLRQELEAQGQIAYDMDSLPVTGYFNRRTMQKLADDVPQDQKTKEWREVYAWMASKSALQEFKAEVGAKTVYLCGTVSNNSDILDQFDKVFVLEVELDVLLGRLKNRTTNPYGKLDIERSSVIRAYPEYVPNLVKSGAIPIDGSMPVARIASTIIATS